MKFPDLLYPCKKEVKIHILMLVVCGKLQLEAVAVCVNEPRGSQCPKIIETRVEGRWKRWIIKFLSRRFRTKARNMLYLSTGKGFVKRLRQPVQFTDIYPFGNDSKFILQSYRFELKESEEPGLEIVAHDGWEFVPNAWIDFYLDRWGLFTKGGDKTV